MGGQKVPRRVDGSRRAKGVVRTQTVAYFVDPTKSTFEREIMLSKKRSIYFSGFHEFRSSRKGANHQERTPIIGRPKKPGKYGGKAISRPSRCSELSGETAIVDNCPGKTKSSEAEAEEPATL
ncbi:hypothetical protein J6590_031965 [Homalodisca vitripennis]|nr:hypothetical protein J6590_031965 [Homalodisca vitripennis]